MSNMNAIGQTWIAYVGPFSFPEGNASTRRVLGNAQALSTQAMPVVVGAVNTPVCARAELVDLPADTGPIFYEGLGAYDRRWAAARKLGALYWNSAAMTLQWLEKQPTRPRAVILYGTAAPFLLQLLPWCRRNRVALICDIVEWYHPGQVLGGRCTPLYWMGQYAMRRLAPQVDGIIGISRYLARYYEGHGCRVLRIPPTLDISQLAVREPSANSDRLALVYAGVPGKKDLLGNALHALRQVDPAGARFRLRIVGPDESAVRRLCPDYPQRAVQILGRQSSEKALAVVREADFSILLRPSERYANAGFPTKVVESLACGTPVICNLTSDLGDHIRDGQEGIVVRDHTVAAFADGLDRARSLGRERLGCMRRAARFEAQRAFDFRAYAKPLQEFAGEVIEDVSGTRP